MSCLGDQFFGRLASIFSRMVSRYIFLNYILSSNWNSSVTFIYLFIKLESCLRMKTLEIDVTH